MQTDPVHAREPGVIARRIAGETILVPARRRAREMALFTLNEVGTWIWERLDGRTPRGAIVAELVERFDVDAPRAARDVESFVAELASAGCVREEAA
jgi:hypothetical protein